MRNSLSGKFERKFGKYAIHNISLYLIICYAVGYLIEVINSSFLNYLTLDPYLIVTKGQVWRLVTWIVVPPETGNLFLTLLMLWFYYSIGTQLERVWGTYRYNVYLFSGMFFTILGSFLLLGYCMIVGMHPASFGNMVIYMLENNSIVYFGAFSTYYINMSIFLAYAATFPDMQVLLMFLIPIRVKYLGIIYGVMLVLGCVGGGVSTWVVVGASLMNFIVFFAVSRKRIHMSPKQIKRRHDFNREVQKASAQMSGAARHKCAVCGRTEKDGDDLEFRFCSKCEGNYEYCQYHLFTHEHVKHH